MSFCVGTSKAIVQVTSPIADRITSNIVPVDVELKDNSIPPFWEIKYTYLYKSPSRSTFLPISTTTCRGYGEDSIIKIELFQLSPGYNIRIFCRGTTLTGLIPEYQWFNLEGYGAGHEAMNLQEVSRAITHPKQERYRLGIRNSNGEIWFKNYTIRPVYEVFCGCKTNECEINCPTKPGGFCCLPKDKIAFFLRKLNEDKEWYEEPLW